MALTTASYVYAGDPAYTINFDLGFIDRSEIQVRINAAVDGSGDPVYANFDWIDDANITITDTLVNGDAIVISRTVPKDALVVDFRAGADITPENMHRQALQGLMVYQELVDGRVGENSPVAAAATAEAASVAAAASAAASNTSAAAAAFHAASINPANLAALAGADFTGDVSVAGAVTVTDNDLEISSDEPTLLLTETDQAGTTNNARFMLGNGAVIVQSEGGNIRMTGWNGIDMNKLSLRLGGSDVSVLHANDLGVGANDVVQLDGSMRLPAVSGRNLTNLGWEFVEAAYDFSVDGGVTFFETSDFVDGYEYMIEAIELEHATAGNTVLTFEFFGVTEAAYDTVNLVGPNTDTNGIFGTVIMPTVRMATKSHVMYASLAALPFSLGNWGGALASDNELSYFAVAQKITKLRVAWFGGNAFDKGVANVWRRK